MKKVTKEFLIEKKACINGYEWWCENCQGLSNVEQIKKLMYGPDINWASWLIVRIFNTKQKQSYAIFAALQVIDIFEKKYPKDKRPRNAIKAAIEVLKKSTVKNKKAAYAAADAAAAAAYAADAAAYAAAAADAAADAAAYAAYAAAYAAAAAAAAAAYTAADAAAYDAAYAAAYAAYAAYAAADADVAAAKRKMKIKILNYGIQMLEGKSVYDVSK